MLILATSYSYIFINLDVYYIMLFYEMYSSYMLFFYVTMGTNSLPFEISYHEYVHNEVKGNLLCQCIYSLYNG